MAFLSSSRTGGQARDRLFSFFVYGSPEFQKVVGGADELPFRCTRRKSSPHEPGRALDCFDLSEDSLHHGASPFQDLSGPIAVHLLFERRGRLFLRFGSLFSLSSPGLSKGVEKELRPFSRFFRNRLFVPVSGIGHDFPGRLLNACCFQGVSGRLQHGKQLMLVVRLLGDLGPHDDLVFGDNDLGIVCLYIPFLAAFHDPALRIGRVGLERFGIDRCLFGFSPPKGAGDLLPLDPLFGFFFLLPFKSLSLDLKIGQTLPDPALSLVFFGQSLGETVPIFLSRPGFLPVRRLRFGQPPLYLLPEVSERPVVVQGRVGLDLGSVQRNAPHFDQSGIFTEQKDLGKEVFQRRSMLLPEPGNGGVVRKKLGRDHPIGDIPHAQPLDLPTRPLSLAVGVKKKRRHDSRIKTRPSPGVPLRRTIEGRQIQGLHRVDQEIGDIILRQPIHHVWRKKKALGAMLRFIKMSHEFFPGKRVCAKSLSGKIV